MPNTSRLPNGPVRPAHRSLAQLSLASASGTVTPSFELPRDMRISNVRCVRAIGPALDQAIFSWLRTGEVVLPQTLSLMVGMFDAVPTFTALTRVVSPAIASVIIGAAYRQTGSLRGDEVRSAIVAQAAQYDVPSEVVERIIEAAYEIADKMSTQATGNMLHNLLRMPVGADDIDRAVGESTSISWNLVSEATGVLAQVFELLNQSAPLASIESVMQPLLRDPDFVRLVVLAKAARTRAVPGHRMSLYALADRWWLRDGVRRLPAIDLAGPEEDLDPRITSLFAMDMPREVRQLKYYKVSSPASDAQISIADIITSITVYDRAFFPISVAQGIDLITAVSYIMVNGRFATVPEFPFSGGSLWDTVGVQQILGLTAIRDISALSGSSLFSAAVNAMNTRYKVNDQNAPTMLILQDWIRAAIAVLDAATSFRRMLGDVLASDSFSTAVRLSTQEDVDVARSLMYSTRTRTSVAIGDRFVIPVDLVTKWANFHTSAMDVLRQVESGTSDPSFIYHPNRLMMMAPLFSIQPVTQPVVFEHPFELETSDDGGAWEVTMRPPHIEISGDGIEYGLTQISDVIFESGSQRNDFISMSQGRGRFSTFDLMTEEIPELDEVMARAIRLIPVSVVRDLGKYGRARTLAQPDAPLSMATVVSELIMRRSPDYIPVSDENSPFKWAYLGMVPGDADLTLINSSNVGTVTLGAAGAFRLPMITYSRPTAGDADARALMAYVGTDFYDVRSSRFVFIFSAPQYRVEERTQFAERFSMIAPVTAAISMTNVPVPPRAEELVSLVDPNFLDAIGMGSSNPHGSTMHLPAADASLDEFKSHARVTLHMTDAAITRNAAPSRSSLEDGEMKDEGAASPSIAVDNSGDE